MNFLLGLGVCSTLFYVGVCGGRVWGRVRVRIVPSDEDIEFLNITLVYANINSNLNVGGWGSNHTPCGDVSRILSLFLSTYKGYLIIIF